MAIDTYIEHMMNLASVATFKRKEHDPIDLVSAETLPEKGSLIDFRSFAQEYPEKLYPLILRLRPEFQELFIEYYLLEKPQHFIGKLHGQIQTRVWQTLRIIEKTIGSYIILGTDPDETVLRPILVKAKLEDTPYGSLSRMIVLYAIHRNYPHVAHLIDAPGPAIRKIFRPAIKTLLAAKDIKAVAVGAYLRSLIHLASLTKNGLSKRCQDRMDRVQTLRFDAPAAQTAPLLNFGHTEFLKDTPWYMLEISSDHRMAQIRPNLQAHGERVFRKKAAQVFAPLTPEGELVFGYLFVRSESNALARSLTHVRGISELSSAYDGDGDVTHHITVPNADVQDMIRTHTVPAPIPVQLNDFVEILTGPASRYCGTVTHLDMPTQKATVVVIFPTGKMFLVFADLTGIKVLPGKLKEHKHFWGSLLS